jgi:hypothetical protein
MIVIMEQTAKLAIIAIAGAIGIIGVEEVVDSFVTPLQQPQQAEAKPNTAFKSCDPFYNAYNASGGRCFQP